MAEDAETFIVPTMQMTAEDLQALYQGRLTPYTAAKIERYAEQILQSQRRIAASKVKIAYATDCGMFPFSHGNLEFQAMVKAGLDPAWVRRAAPPGPPPSSSAAATSASSRPACSPTSSPCPETPSLTSPPPPKSTS